MTSIKKKIILFDLNLIEFNVKVIEQIKNCQEEINYKILDIDYPKSVQRTLIQNNPLFKTTEKQFLDFTINLNEKLPLIPSTNIFNKVSSLIEFNTIDRDVSLIFSQLKTINFQLVFSLIKFIFNNISKTRNNSIFINKITDVINSNPDSWLDIEAFGNDCVFYLLNLFVNISGDFKIYISESNILRELDSNKNVHCIYHKKSTFTNDGIKNLYQQIINTNEEILLESIPFINHDKPKPEYEIFSYIIIDNRIKKTELDGFNIPTNSHNKFLKQFYSLFHQPTINFLNERKHNYIYNNLFTYLNTFNIFLHTKIKPIDIQRYLLAGSVIKSAYNVRDCADVDFFILDHEDNIEKYGRYAPDVGIPGIFDDFGKTYYANEEFYFPMIPEMYERQKEIKKKEIIPDKSPKNITNNFPKFSVSGLKAGRYIDIYSSECKKIGFDIDNLDELVTNPNNRIYFLGCPVIQLKLEMVRDNVKDIDLGRVSRKQLHDLHFLKTNYEYLFSRNESIEFCFEKLKDKEKFKKSKIHIGLNCYHKELISEDKVGYDLVIRRYPLFVEDITAKIINESPLLISRDNDVYYDDCRLTYQKPLISSLPATLMTPSKVEVNVIYYFEVSEMGEIKIFINTEDEMTDVSFFRNVCMTGNMKVEINDGIKKIFISISGNKMKKIYSQIPTYDKKYKLLLINLMRNIIQTHKIIDCHTKEKITIDVLKRNSD